MTDIDGTEPKAQDGMDHVTLGDKTVETNQFDRYKGRLNVVDRIAILSTTLIRAYTYYYEGNGKKTTFRIPTNAETLAFVKKTLGEPTQRFGLILFHYKTGDDGILLDETKCQGRPKLWVISEARYEELSNIHRQWPMLDAGVGAPQHDLQIKCSEEKFQRMNFTPCPTAHWKTNPKWYAALKERESKAQERLKLAMGRTMTDMEIMSLLGGTSAPNVTGAVGNSDELDLSDVIED